MTGTFGCGHPRTPENEVKMGIARPRINCRICRLAAKSRWRERARAIAEGDAKRKPGPAPIVEPTPANDGMSPEAYGSRRLLEAYARYYEKHVRRSAA